MVLGVFLSLATSSIRMKAVENGWENLLGGNRNRNEKMRRRTKSILRDIENDTYRSGM
jgi:hypothetical protein